VFFGNKVIISENEYRPHVQISTFVLDIFYTNCLLRSS